MSEKDIPPAIRIPTSLAVGLVLMLAGNLLAGVWWGSALTTHMSHVREQLKALEDRVASETLSEDVIDLSVRVKVLESKVDSARN